VGSKNPYRPLKWGFGRDKKPVITPFTGCHKVVNIYKGCYAFAVVVGKKDPTRAFGVAPAGFIILT